MITTQEKERKSLNKLNDAAFKALFRSVEARRFIARFLSEVTGIPKEDIMNANFVGGELTKSYINEKGQVADVMIQLINQRNTILVEMNERLDNFKNQDKFRGIMKIGAESVPIASKAFYQAILININNFNQDKVDFPIQKFELKDQISNIYFRNPLIIYNVI